MDMGEQSPAHRHDLPDSGDESCLLEQPAPGALPVGAAAMAQATTMMAALTTRQRQVADLAASGMSARRIAKTLWISEATVRHHQMTIAAKLGLPRSLVGSVAYLAHVAGCSDGHCSAAS